MNIYSLIKSQCHVSLTDKNSRNNAGRITVRRANNAGKIAKKREERYHRAAEEREARREAHHEAQSLSLPTCAKYSADKHPSS